MAKLKAAMIILTGMLLPVGARAEVVQGRIMTLYADPSDVVVVLDKPGHCGSAFYELKRTNDNFRELSALLMTGFAADKTIGLFTTDPCRTDRQIISHGFMTR